MFARPAEACLPFLVPHGYFRFSLAEEHSVKSSFFRGIKLPPSSSLKMRGKFEMAFGPVVAEWLGSYLGLKNRGVHVPSVEFSGPAESCLCFFWFLAAIPFPNPIQLRKSWLNCVLNSVY